MSMGKYNFLIMEPRGWGYKLFGGKVDNGRRLNPGTGEVKEAEEGQYEAEGDGFVCRERW